jgi:putative membrane protein
MNLPAVDPTAQTEPTYESLLPKDIAWKDLPRVLGSGLAMGTADVVPGVSGGTMAVACGIYMELLAAINSINGRALQALARLRFGELLQVVHWRFMVSLGLGIGLAFVVMLRVVGLPRLLQEHPTEVYAVFFGLVLASVFVLARRVEGWTAGRVGAGVVGAALGFAIVNLVPVATPDNPAFVFLCGVIAICAMILPGISGSFVLLILGKYEYVISSVERLMHFDLGALAVVVPFAAGCVVGLASFSRLLSWMLARWHQPMLAGLTGLLVGSLWRIWPFQEVVQQEVRGKLKVVSATPFWPTSFQPGVLGLVLAGLAAVVAVEILAARRSAD